MNTMYTNSNNLSNWMHTDVKCLCAQFNVTGAQKCPHCEVKHKQYICSFYTLFITLNAGVNKKMNPTGIPQSELDTVQLVRTELLFRTNHKELEHCIFQT